MKYDVRLTAKAERDIESVLRWFAEQQTDAAAGRWVKQLENKIATLERMPMRCALAAEAPELEIELRELLFGRRAGKFRILFVVEGSVVLIAHIRHAARDSAGQEDLGSQ